LALALLDLVLLWALGSGLFALAPAQLAEALWARATGATSPLAPAAETVLRNIRLPRIAAGLAVGAMLAAAGAAYQGMFRNPLVSPDILGVSAGAGLGAVVAIYLGLSMFAVQWLAFGGGLVAVAVVVAISACVRRHDPVLVLVLAGIALGALLGAGIALIKTLADPNTQLPSITFWLMGGLSAVTLQEVVATAPVMLAALGLMLSVYVRQLENFAGTMNFVIFPMFFISPALYPLWKLEESGAWWLHQLALVNPFTHAVEMLRFASVGQVSPLATGVVLGCTVVFFVLALWGYDPQRGWIKQKGGA
jgi:ABC-type enterobactin transport system permease subunit